jgi:hypothetical protein
MLFKITFLIMWLCEKSAVKETERLRAVVKKVPGSKLDVGRSKL